VGKQETHDGLGSLTPRMELGTLRSIGRARELMVVVVCWVIADTGVSKTSECARGVGRFNTNACRTTK
jgi:hypothetical protein